MIKHCRIDSRLIHGQVATFWTNDIGVDRIVVVSEEVSQNQLQVNMLKLAKPTGIKLSILRPKTAYKRFTDGTYDEDSILVIFDSLKSVKELIEIQGDNENLITYLNVGNIPSGDGKIQVKRSVYLSKEEFETLLELESIIDVIDARMVPNDEAMDFTKLAKEKFKGE